MGKLDANTVYDPTREYSLRLAKMCKTRSIRFVFASSCSVYGTGSDSELTEESPTSPQTHYSLNKLQIEQDLEFLSDESFSPIALRFATVFGISPRIRFDIVINMFVGMALTEGKIVLNSDGLAWRPNIHINDVCKAILLAIHSDYSRPELLILNVGDSRNNIRIIDLASQVSSLVPSSEVAFLSQDPNLDKEGLITDRKIQTKVVTQEVIRSHLPKLIHIFLILFATTLSNLVSLICLINFKTSILI